MNQLESPDEYWMRHAYGLALRAAQAGEVPVGAVIIKDGELISEGWNLPISHADPTAHAEIQALRAAGRTLNNYRLNGTTLYVTLEPCPMCAGAMVHARVQRVVFGAVDPRSGAAGSVFNILQSGELNHRCEVVGGVMAPQCADLLREFFRRKR